MELAQVDRSDQKEGEILDNVRTNSPTSIHCTPCETGLCYNSLRRTLHEEQF